MRILIVDDDVDLARQLTRLWPANEHDILAVSRTPDLPSLVQDVTPQLVVCEPLIFGWNEGLAQCRRIRATCTGALLLVISTRAQVEDKLNAFAAGADDYLVKPFDIRELYARILALLRRCIKLPMNGGPHLLRITPQMELDFQRHVLIGQEKEIALRPLEFKLLTYFLQNPNIILSREQVLETIWGYDYLGDTREVDIYVHYLRQKIEPFPDKPQYIRTIWGRGYMWTYSHDSSPPWEEIGPQ